MAKILRIAPILTAALAFGSIQAQAAEPLPRHPACGDPRFEFWRHDVQQLREIAYRCDSPAAVRLFLNRADYLQLWERWGHLAAIDGTGEVGRRMIAYRLLIGLLESFAQEMPEPAPGWMVTLNQGYEQGRGFSEGALQGFGSEVTRRP